MPRDNATSLLPAPQRFMTAAEYYEQPEGPPYSQLIDGELIMSPSPNFFHQRIIANLFRSLDEHVRRHRCGVVVFAPADVELDEGNVFQPDLYFVSRERRHLIDEHGVKGAPDFVIEVISGSGGLDLGRKKKGYVRGEVPEFWTVFPRTKEVHLWRLAESIAEPAFRFAMGDTVRTPTLPGWEMPVAEIFAE